MICVGAQREVKASLDENSEVDKVPVNSKADVSCILFFSCIISYINLILTHLEGQENQQTEQYKCKLSLFFSPNQQQGKKTNKQKKTISARMSLYQSS